MKRSLVLTAGLLAAFAVQARGAVIDIPNLVVDVGTPFVDVAVAISGGDSITDMSAIVFSGRGGSLTGNPDAPPLIDISPSDPATPVFDYAGSIWEDTTNAPGGFTPSAGVLPPPSELLDEQVTLNTSGQNVVADGTLLTFRVDTSGLADGDSFELSLGEPGLQLTTLTNSGAAVDVTFNNGSISARSATAAIPEPSSLLLAALVMTPAVLCARRRRR